MALLYISTRAIGIASVIDIKSISQQPSYLFRDVFRSVYLPTIDPDLWFQEEFETELLGFCRN